MPSRPINGENRTDGKRQVAEVSCHAGEIPRHVQVSKALDRGYTGPQVVTWGLSDAVALV